MDALEFVTYESYESRPKIDGVWTRKLSKFRSLEGSFMECMRLTEGVLEGDSPFEPRQISLSWAQPQRINAFHIHPKERQDELWCVVQGGLQIWLVDLRQSSPTRGLRQRLYLSGEEPTWLFIPSGVAHGYKASLEGALLMYATSSQFNWMDPNEGRLPFDHFGADLWEDNRG